MPPDLKEGGYMDGWDCTYRVLHVYPLHNQIMLRDLYFWERFKLFWDELPLLWIELRFQMRGFLKPAK